MVSRIVLQTGLVGVMLSWASAAYSAPCYVAVEKAGNFNPKIIESSAVALISEYVEPVERPPFSGMRPDDCVYNISLSESMQGFMVLVSGRNLNAVGNSRIPGLDGFTQSMLKAIMGSKKDTTTIQKICRGYAEMMKDDCKPISAAIFFYDKRRMPIEDGGRVREGDEFNVMIQPEGNLYAYVINKDTSGNFFRIFPNPQVSSETNPLTSGKQHYFPPKHSDLVFSFDGNTGTEIFYFVMSASPMDDLDEFFRQLDNADSPQRKKAILPFFEKSFLSRGMALSKKKDQPSANAVSEKEEKLDQKIGEILEGTGTFIKTVRLRHE